MKWMRERMLVLVALFWISAGPSLRAQDAAEPSAGAAAASAGDKESDKADAETDAKDGDAEAKPQTEEENKKADEEAAKKAKADAAKKKRERLDKIKATKFSRTVGEVLKAWAPPTPDDEPEDKEDPAEESGEDGEEKKEPDPIDAVLEKLKEAVLLGDWAAVKKGLAELDKDFVGPAYQQIVTSLQKATPPSIEDLDPVYKSVVERARIEKRPPPRNEFALEDVIGILRVAPEEEELDEATIKGLGTILRTSLESGVVLEKFMLRFEQETSGGKIPQRLVGKVLNFARHPVEMGEFLPGLDVAIKDQDYEALNLLSSHYQSRYVQEDQKDEDKNKAWQATRAVLESKESKGKQRDVALKQAITLSSMPGDELGGEWLKKSFAEDPNRGMEVMRVVGTATAESIFNQPSSAYSRHNTLKLQSAAVEALLAAAPEQAKKWQSTLTVLAGNWLREAGLTYRYDRSAEQQSGYQFDRFGNYYYAGGNAPVMASNGLQAIPVATLLEEPPSEKWIDAIEDSLQPQFDIRLAQLRLKAKDDEKAFPHIVKLATALPEQAKDLCEEYIRVWTRNHDPNANDNSSSRYYYYYRAEEKAESIPLTRSKQERNLKDLAVLVKKLRSLPIEDLDETLLARAFTVCHSSAEVYQLDSIQHVFGSLDGLEAKTLAELVQQMRGNLLGLWRSPAVQKNNKTNRRQKDIQREVSKGYQVGKEVLAAALKRYPEDWSLRLAHAALAHDENNYRQELAPEADFTSTRSAAMEHFRKAAEFYVAQADGQEESDESIHVFSQWYYASIGASDLAAVKDDMILLESEPPLIRAALESLPAESGERHLKDFANSLFVDSKQVPAAVKHRYLKAGLAIVGDHENAREAREIFDYYSDLVTEIQLEAKVDGSTAVGHGSPFGVFINIRHTREIERESGGFTKYLQNQNNSTYYYNYGRPKENYREKFEEVVRGAMKEHFEVLSVTFQKEDVHSRAVEEYGWRETPYAYILLQARGAEIDKIPSVRLDLDFLDTSGYVVLPIESPEIPIDCKADDGEARPVANLKISQILDERQAADGKLMLEVNASGQGLVPELEELLSFPSADFVLGEVSAQPVSASRFEEDGEGNAIISERRWIVEFNGRSDLATLPKTFAFGAAQADGIELSYQRFSDADLVDVDGQIVILEESYGKIDHSRKWYIAGGVLAGILLLIFLVRGLARSGGKPVVENKFAIPETLTPFTLLGLLRKINAEGGFDESGRKELAESIHRVERSCFAAQPSRQAVGGEGVARALDLEALADNWVKRARS